MKKSLPCSLTVKPRTVSLRSSALILVTLIQMSVVAGPGPTSLEAPNPVTAADCVTSAKTASTGIAKNGEYQLTYSTRSVPHSDPTGRKYVGYHCWRETDPASHSFSWESDAVNAMNDFMICRYSLGGNMAKEVYLYFGPGSIEFTNKDGSGRGDALVLAVYEGDPPATLFRGKAIDFGKPLYGPKRWIKSDKVSSLTIELLKIPVAIRPGVKNLSVVLVSVDGWFDTRTAIQIKSLRVLSNPIDVKKPMRKK